MDNSRHLFNWVFSQENPLKYLNILFSETMFHGLLFANQYLIYEENIEKNKN